MRGAGLGSSERPPCSALDHTHAGWKMLLYHKTVRLLLTWVHPRSRF